MSNVARPNIKNVVFVAGPGGFAFNNTNINNYVNNFKAAGAKVTVVGDGVSDISLTSVKNAVASQDGPSTIVVQAHGKIADGKAVMIFGKENPFMYDFIVEMQIASGNNHIDFFVTSCEVGRNIHEEIGSNLLSQGSILVTLSGNGYGASVAGSDVSRLYDNLPRNQCYGANGFGADQLLYYYLIADLQNRINPTVYIGGHGKYAIFERGVGLGNKYQLSSNIASFDDLTHVSKVADKLNKRDIWAVDYDTALAFGFSAVEHLSQMGADCSITTAGNFDRCEPILD